MGSMTDTPHPEECDHAFSQPMLVEHIAGGIANVFVHNWFVPRVMTAADAWALSSYWVRVAQMIEEGESGEVVTA
jgi:hypothetical protein